MSDGAAAVQTATPVPGQAEQTSTAEGGKLITHDRLVDHLNKKRAERGEPPIDADDGKPEAKEGEANKLDPNKDPIGKADEPKDDPAAKAKEFEAKAKDLEAKVQHFEKREADWSSVTDKLIAQRDYYKQIADQVGSGLEQHGLELDPTAQENAYLKSQLAEFNRAQERARAQAEYEQRNRQEQGVAQYRNEIQSAASSLASRYPELNPRSNPELAEAFFRGWAAKGGDARDLEQKAMAYVQKVRGSRAPANGQAPRTLAGTRSPGKPLPVGRDWSDVRAWHAAKYGNNG